MRSLDDTTWDMALRGIAGRRDSEAMQAPMAQGKAIAVASLKADRDLAAELLTALHREPAGLTRDELYARFPHADPERIDVILAELDGTICDADGVLLLSPGALRAFDAWRGAGMSDSGVCRWLAEEAVR